MNFKLNSIVFFLFLNVIQFLFFPEKLFCQEVPENKLIIKAIRIEESIQLTGKVKDPNWLKSEPVTLEYEVTPGDNTPAPEKTLVKVMYDENNLYFGFQCFDSNPKLIRANVTDRDKIFDDDFVLIAIDTYGDYERAYEFVVNPFGIQGDLLASSGGEDPNVDFIWESKAEINEEGWTAEIAIPFSSLKFPDSEEQQWRINIMRLLPRLSRVQVSWMKIDRNIPSIMKQAGYLMGLRNIQSGSTLELLPYVIGEKTGSLSDHNDPGSGLNYKSIEGRIGGSIKYSPSSNFSLDGVINPDFSQIESDADQISVNTTFALYYPEKRPFFLIGREMLNTPMYYSRSINDPLAAGRIIGKSGALSYLYMSAYDRNTIIVVPGEERSNTVSTSLKSLVNIGRLRYDLGDESFIGGILLTRNLSEGNNYVIGLDWKYKFWNNWYFNGEGFLSSTNEIIDTSFLRTERRFENTNLTAKFDGEKYTGNVIHLVLSHLQRSYNFTLIFNNFSPAFQTYNGRISSTGYKQLFMDQEFTFYPENSFINRVRFGFYTNLNYNFGNIRKNFMIQPYLGLSLKSQTNIYAAFYLINEERFSNTYFKNLTRFNINIISNPINEISLFIEGTVGKYIYRTAIPKLGEGHNLTFDFTLRPTNQLNVSFSYTRSALRDVETNELFYDGNIYRMVGIYQFSPEIFLRTIVQYNSFEKRFQFYPLFNYKLNAFTTFYAGMTSHYLDYGNSDGIVNTDQQYFIKAQYLFNF